MFLLPAAAMSNISTSIFIPEEATTSISSETRPRDHFSFSSLLAPLSPPHHHPQPPPPKAKKKRNQPGNPDPDAEVVALSPKTLMATNRFVCEICTKGFQRDQNLQLHRRGHNLPWKLRQKSSGGKEGAGGGPSRKRVYVCPEPSCVHHHPSRALGDLTGIKKHFSRKHGEKKWKCERCAKRYAVHSDWKAHVKACGTREYRCDCGTLFSRKDTFITHRAFCDALAEESTRLMSAATAASPPPHRPLLLPSILNSNNLDIFNTPISPHLSATALLQRASAMGLLSFSNSLSTGLGYSAPTPLAAGGRGDVIQYLQPTWQGAAAAAGGRSTRGFIGGVELLPDLVTASTSYAPPTAGGPVRTWLAGFPPATGTWS